jgi:hypothetical protein
MQKFCVAIVLLLAVTGTLAFSRACAGGQPQPTSVTSPVCSTETGLCTVARGGALTGTIVFSAQSAQASLAPVYTVRGPTGNFIIPTTQNACDSISPACPTTTGTTYTWNLNVPVPTQVPAFLQGVPFESKFKVLLNLEDFH